MRIEGFLEQSAKRFSNKTAVVVDGRSYTYGELNELATRFSSALRQAGLSRGDRVIVYLDNSIEAVVAIFGTVRARGVFSLVNAMTKPAKLRFIASNLRPRFIVTQSRLLASCEEAIKDVPCVEGVFVTDPRPDGAAAGPNGATSDLRTRPFWSAVEAASPKLVTEPAIDLDLAYVSYTSGSTGVPKGVMMTHQSSVMGTRSMMEYLEKNSDDRILSVIPLSFDYGLYQVIMSVAGGCTLYLETSFAFPNRVLRKMAAESITVFPLVPTTAAIIVGL